MAKREGISKRLRFEVFKRDGFRCVYCGSPPTAKPLHADHVIAVVNGGKTEAANLVTACADCNLGKSDIPLDRKVLTPQLATQADRDHAQQILEYLRLQREIQAAREQVADVIADRWEELIGPMTQRMYSHLDALSRQWSMADLEEAMQIVGRKLGCPGEDFRVRRATQQAQYFFGVLRRFRREVEDGVRPGVER